MKFLKTLFLVSAFIFIFCLSPKYIVRASNHSPLDLECPGLQGLTSIPEDGSWLQICWKDPSAPLSGTVKTVDIKVQLNHPDPTQIEIRLSRSDTEFYLPLEFSDFDENGIASISRIQAFSGHPSSGEWIIEIRDTTPGMSGEVANVSVSAVYATGSLVPDLLNAGDGIPAQFRISDQAVRIKEFNEIDDKTIQNRSANLLSSSSSVVIMSQDFEGAFPPPLGWELFDNYPEDGKVYLWDDDDHRPYNGDWAAWPANGGADGLDPAFSDYPNNMGSGMTYGPFDLTNAKSARVSFRLWRQIEEGNDRLVFGWSTDGMFFEGYYWDGSGGWDEISVSLEECLGQSNVWVGWYFQSDSSVQFEGPWVDDIVLEFEPEVISVRGQIRYYDRKNQIQPASDITVELWDSDADDGGADDLLASVVTDPDNGTYIFSEIQNWDIDGTGSDPNERRLDIYAQFKTENSVFKVTNKSGFVYAWLFPTRANVGGGIQYFNTTIQTSSVSRPALWIFDDIRRAKDFYFESTFPFESPGFLTAHWEQDQNSEHLVPSSHFWANDDPHVFIAHDSRLSSDTVVHELGHHVMWNQTGQWFWYQCGWSHEIFGQELTQCAWSEGWADFFAISVNGDGCYDFDVGPCTGPANIRHFDLEHHNRNDPNVDGSWWGDGVEGRVAGALYDLMDFDNEDPWYDFAFWGFDPIADIALDGNGHISFEAFWNNSIGNDRHNGVRSVHQNTIDYNHPPVFDLIPDQTILQNFPHTHLLDLWDYTYDAESPVASLSYVMDNVSDLRCGISVESHWVNAAPQLGWTGSCYVSILASDTLESATGGFWLHVTPISSRIYLPVIIKD